MIKNTYYYDTYNYAPEHQVICLINQIRPEVVRWSALSNIPLYPCLNRDIYQFILKCMNYKVDGIICIGLLKQTTFVFLNSFWTDVD